MVLLQYIYVLHYVCDGASEYYRHLCYFTISLIISRGKSLFNSKTVSTHNDTVAQWGKNNIDSKMECIKSNSVLNLCSVLKCSSLDQWTGWAFEVIHPLIHMYITIYCSHIWFRKKKHEWSSTSFRSLFWASLAFQFYSNRRMERILWFLRESSNKIL